MEEVALERGLQRWLWIAGRGKGVTRRRGREAQTAAGGSMWSPRPLPGVGEERVRVVKAARLQGTENPPRFSKDRSEDRWAQGDWT